MEEKEKENTENKPVVARNEDGHFLPGVSGNPAGRPKGSKNRITLLKIAAEEAGRTRNFDKMLEVVQQTVVAALDGDKQARKLVWESIMSGGLSDSDGKGREKVEIKIGSVRENDSPITITGETTNEEENDG